MRSWARLRLASRWIVALFGLVRLFVLILVGIVELVVLVVFARIVRATFVDIIEFGALVVLRSAGTVLPSSIDGSSSNPLAGNGPPLGMLWRLTAAGRCVADCYILGAMSNQLHVPRHLDGAGRGHLVLVDHSRRALRARLTRAGRRAGVPAAPGIPIAARRSGRAGCRCGIWSCWAVLRGICAWCSVMCARNVPCGSTPPIFSQGHVCPSCALVVVGLVDVDVEAHLDSISFSIFGSTVMDISTSRTPAGRGGRTGSHHLHDQRARFSL
jgi:hypothetical protein